MPRQRTATMTAAAVVCCHNPHRQGLWRFHATTFQTVTASCQPMLKCAQLVAAKDRHNVDSGGLPPLHCRTVAVPCRHMIGSRGGMEPPQFGVWRHITAAFFSVAAQRCHGPMLPADAHRCSRKRGGGHRGHARASRSLARTKSGVHIMVRAMPARGYRVVTPHNFAPMICTIGFLLYEVRVSCSCSSANPLFKRTTRFFSRLPIGPHRTNRALPVVTLFCAT